MWIKITYNAYTSIHKCIQTYHLKVLTLCEEITLTAWMNEVHKDYCCCFGELSKLFFNKLKDT